MKKIIITLVLSLFILNIGLSQKISSRLNDVLKITPRTSSDNRFIPILIMLKDQINAEEYRHQNLSEQAKAILKGLQEKAKTSQKPLVDTLEKWKTQGHVKSYKSYWLVNLIKAEVKGDYIRTLETMADIKYLDINAQLELERPINEVMENNTESINGTEPGLRIINAPRLWEMNFTGRGRIMMSSDTGVDVTHPALSRTWRGRDNRVPAVPASHAWYDTSQNPTDRPSDCDSHGTHVTGIMGGLDPNRNDTIGVAFEAEWIAARSICINRGTDIDNHIETFQWAMNPDNDPDTTNDVPDVINNSWHDPASEVCNPIYEQWFTTLENAGIAVVFSAGNSGPGERSITMPKNINTTLVNTFTVGNIVGQDYLNGDLDPISNRSSRGPSGCGGEGSLLIKPEVSAPGTRVRSSVPGGRYGHLTGTSMAAPHVSGAIVLLKQAFPNLSGEAIKLALYNTTIDLGAPGEDNTYGTGLIDVFAAYQLLDVACENRISINENINSDRVVNAGERITASSRINSGVDVTFAAGEEILLNPGFHATRGSLFSAIIRPCGRAQNQVNNRALNRNDNTPENINVQDDNLILVYPNPTSSKVTVTNSKNSATPYSLIIVDVYGRIMFYKDNITSNKTELQTQSWSSGVYYGRIQDRNNVKFIKIMKE